ncbi:MAG: major facilitator super transporter protein, partial [Bogoriella megaspora]
MMKIVSLVLANALIPLSVLIFAIGFFPYKPFLPGLATYEDSEVLGYEGPLGRPFDRVVFMVVDALRRWVGLEPSEDTTEDVTLCAAKEVDLSSRRDVDHEISLIRNGHAIPYTAHATSPTITMPRVKALTTGSIPSFLDVILNFAESDTSATLAGQDTWLAQLKARGKQSKWDGALNEGERAEEEENKLVFYGDDTWLKLFPGFFSDSDGTSSFFVSDFTEVDNNVTRHIPTALSSPPSDWSALILHYLGLDHIGHKAGPRSPNMVPKQREMDSIVETIYESMLGGEDGSAPPLDRTLLVLCGDHGMNEGGNHGASSEGETSPALVFVSPLLGMLGAGDGPLEGELGRPSPITPKSGTDYQFYHTVEQSDIVPTLAGLLGTPVPKNNLGVFIEGLLGFWEDEAQLQLLLQNARQMLNIVQATFPGEDYDGEHVQTHVKPNSAGAELALKWRKVDGLVKAKANGAQLRKEHIVPLALDFCKSAQETLSSTASNYNIAYLAAGICTAALAVLLTLCSIPLSWPPGGASIFFASTIIAYGLMMFASSYVEEEQHFWYWLTGGWIVFLYTKSSRTRSLSSKDAPPGRFQTPHHSALLALFLHRLSTHWTTTGIKHAGAPSISTLFLPGGAIHPTFLWLLISATYLYNIDLLVKVCALPRRISATQNSKFWSAVRVTAAVSVGAIALAFKVLFTAAEAPELVRGLGAWVGLVENLSSAFGIGLVGMARGLFLGLGLGFVSVVWEERMWRSKGLRRAAADKDLPSLPARLRPLLTLFLLTQSRAQNIPLFLIFEFEAQALYNLLSFSYPLHPTSSTFPSSPSISHILPLSLTTLLLTHVSFFAPGGSNSIASIDLSNAYNGVSGYEVGLVGVLVFCGNWAGPIWWAGIGWSWLYGNPYLSPHLGKKGSDAGKEERKWVLEERESLMRTSNGGVGVDSTVE